MQLNEVGYPDGIPVDGYGPGFFRVQTKVIDGGILILPGLVTTWDGFDDIAAIAEAAERIDVLFLGTGSQMRPIPDALRTPLETIGIAVENMGSAAACRTYNVLLSEGRRVGIAALPVD